MKRLAIGVVVVVAIGCANGPSAPVALDAAVGSEPEEARRAIDRVRPFERSAFTEAVDVTPSARADLPFSLVDRGSGAAISVALEGARPIEAAHVADHVVFTAATSEGATVVHRATSDGLEDFVLLERPPATRALRYRVSLDRGVAGLRLVARTLELVDGTGTPRLRVAPPYVIDAHGAAHEASIAVEGCAVDRDPRSPWGRAPVAPGARTCTVVVGWDDVAYPAIVDPAWSSAKTMATARAFASAALVSIGGVQKVLVAGGEGASGPLSSAELYDVTTNAWAATNAMPTAATRTPAFVLPDSTVLVVYDTNGRIYAPSTATWSTTGALAVARKGHAAAMLDPKAGNVIVAGGGSAKAEVYNPTTKTFSSVGSISADRIGACAASTGTTLVVAGGANPSTSAAVATTDVYTASGGWTVGPAMNNARVDAFCGFAGGGIAVLGGHTTLTAGVGVAEAEIFGGTTWNNVLATPPIFDVAVAANAVGIHAIGGVVSSAGPVYTTQSSAFVALGGTDPSMTTARYGAVAVTIPEDQSILVAGGAQGFPTVTSYLSSAERLKWTAIGGACTTASDCAFDDCSGTCICPDRGASSCSYNGKPDGLGGCTLYPSGTSCGSPSCVNGVQNAGSACDGLGACNAVSPTPCATGYGCNGTTCATSCADDSTCASGFYCDPPTARCLAKKPQGAACTAADQCTSNVCADGVCCDKACNGCNACSAKAKGSGVDGVCDVIAADTDPHDFCPPDPAFPASCQQDGMCDGTGICRRYAKAGVACGATTCSGGSVSGQTCNGAGTCATSTIACAPYQCAPNACATTCAADTDCASGAFCTTSSTCSTKKPNGEACGAGKECTSGLCVDGFCCNDACGGSCQACDVKGNEGTCFPVTGPVHGSRTACTGAGTDCGGTCDGSGASCVYPPATKSCGSSCTAGKETKSTCDGLGACTAGAASSCGAYACSGDACATSCDQDAQCSTGFKCAADHTCTPASATCSADGTSATSSDGVTRSCAPYLCDVSTGGCFAVCASSDQCAAGNTCDSTTKTCVVGANPQTGSSGGCATTSSPTDGPWAWVVVVGGAVVALRRRRR